MSAVDALKAEHVQILRMVEALSGICDILEKGAEVPAADLSTVLEFITQYADTLHHEKEERVLFPAMRAAGLAPEDSSVDDAIKGHRNAREQVRGMSDALAAYASDPAAGATFARCARSYVYLLRHHIAVEETVIFPRARLTVTAHEEILQGYEDTVEDLADEGKIEALIFRLDRLHARYR